MKCLTHKVRLQKKDLQVIQEILYVIFLMYFTDQDLKPRIRNSAYDQYMMYPTGCTEGAPLLSVMINRQIAYIPIYRRQCY